MFDSPLCQEGFHFGARHSCVDIRLHVLFDFFESVVELRSKEKIGGDSCRKESHNQNPTELFALNHEQVLKVTHGVLVPAAGTACRAPTEELNARGL